MNFSLTEEQIQLRDSLRRVLTETYTLERRRATARSGSGCDPAIWRQFAELGLASPHSEAALRWSLAEAEARCGELIAVFTWQTPRSFRFPAPSSGPSSSRRARTSSSTL